MDRTVIAAVALGQLRRATTIVCLVGSSFRLEDHRPRSRCKDGREMKLAAGADHHSQRRARSRGRPAWWPRPRRHRCAGGPFRHTSTTVTSGVTMSLSIPSSSGRMLPTTLTSFPLSPARRRRSLSLDDSVCEGGWESTGCKRCSPFGLPESRGTHCQHSYV